MPRKIEAFVDAKGGIHTTPRAAAISDIAQIFGSTEGMATGIANTVLDKRAQLIALLQEYDGLMTDWDDGNAPNGHGKKE